MAILTNKEVVEITYNGTALPMPTGGSAFIVVTSRPTAVLTCDSQTYTLGANETVHSFSVDVGTYSVAASLNGRSLSTSVVVTDNQPYYADLTAFKKLPDAYQEVEWIKNTSTSHILTSYIPTKASRFDIKFSLQEIGDKAVFGCRSSGDYATLNSQCYCALNTNSSDTLLCCLRLASTTENTSNAQAQRSWSNYTRPVVGTIYECIGMYCCNSMNDMAYPISIFGFNNQGTVADAKKVKGTIYYVKAYENNVLMAEWIPCYNKTSGVIGMYETVSGTFLTNAGSGTFTKGADVN